MQTRREFLKRTAGTAAGTAVFGMWGRSAARAATAGNGVSPALRKFITPLRALGPEGIPVATPDTTTYPGVDFYQIGVAEHKEQLHPDLPGPTTLWGYYDKSAGGDNRKVHLGGLIVANQNRPVRVQVSNDLDPAGAGLPHILPVDSSLLMRGEGPRRIAPHLHGGFTPWMSDGTPFQTIEPDNRSRCPPDRAPAATNTSGIATSWSTRSTT